jgi:hypothetical protein
LKEEEGTDNTIEGRRRTDNTIEGRRRNRQHN